MKDKPVDIKINPEITGELERMTKKELIERIYILALDAGMANKKLEQTEKEAKNKIDELQTKLAKAKAYVEQGRAMINAVMDRWYEYDT